MERKLPGYPADEDVKIGPPFLTRYEKARLVAARMYQLYMGAPPLIDPATVGTEDLYTVALEEVLRGVLPVSIYRVDRAGRHQAISLRKLLEKGVAQF